MNVAFGGTRGSVPVSGKNFVKYGGNTTCLRIESECIPKRQALFVDGGSGIIPLSQKAVADGIDVATILFTHYHHDHTQGLPLSPLLFIEAIQLNCYGPIEKDVDPKKMLELLIKPPLFPISYRQVRSHISGKGIDHPPGMVFVVHPRGGLKLMPLNELKHAESNSGQVTFSKSVRYALAECLVIRMYKTHHPEETISYRFEERPTGKVFVFMTDHENEDGTPQSLAAHLRDVDLLVMDCQYTRENYDARTAGFGHGTPDYCVQVAHRAGAGCLGLTHHDPFATDTDVDSILAMAQAEGKKLDYPGRIMACADLQQIQVGRF